MQNYVLETKKLTKVYKQGNVTVKALFECNIGITKGEFVAVIGPSGSGKSTLLNLCGILDEPSGGKVIIDGIDTSLMTAAEKADVRCKKIGYIFQNYNLLPILSAYENIIMPSLLDKRKTDKTYVNELIASLGLTDRIDHLPSQLSGGQQQRVAIARALVNKPALIFADEPTGNLDKKTGKEVLELLLASVKKFDQTLIIITHDNDIASMADRVIKIVDGSIE